VYLLIRNLKTQRRIKKLDYIKVKLFLITKVKGLVNYRLDLPTNTRIYLVFHILLLEPVDPKTLV